MRPAIDLVPPGCLELLPFNAEPIRAWRAKTDLKKFLVALYSFEATVTNAAGVSTTEDISFYGRMLFDKGRSEGVVEAKKFGEFARNAVPPPAAAANADAVPTFANDPAFGRAWKSRIAWRAITGHILEESLFFSIAHTLEAEADLDVSFLLAGQLYYKHALQSLRGMLEDFVTPLYFCVRPHEFSEWRAGHYTAPPMRGRDGILSRLVAAGVTTKVVTDRVADLYGRLNSAIHTSERHLIHRGRDYNQYRGKTFKRDDFDEWTNDIAEAVAVGVAVVEATVGHWGAVRNEHPLICAICHNWQNMTMTRSTFAGVEQVEVRCDVCHHEALYDADFVDGIIGA